MPDERPQADQPAADRDSHSESSGPLRVSRRDVPRGTAAAGFAAAPTAVPGLAAATIPEEVSA